MVDWLVRSAPGRRLVGIEILVYGEILGDKRVKTDGARILISSCGSCTLCIFENKLGIEK